MGLGVDLFINECVVCYSFGTLSAILQSFLQNILPGFAAFVVGKRKMTWLAFFFVLESLMIYYLLVFWFSPIVYLFYFHC